MKAKSKLNLPIGGFFPEEELSPSSKSFIHADAIALKSGRACLNLILQEIEPTKIFIPYYICDVIFQAIEINQIPFEFYNINKHFDPVFEKGLQKEELFLYINFFGLKSETVKNLHSKYGKRLLLDNTHAFFEKGDQADYCFNSARKFFGVSDGGFLYTTDQNIKAHTNFTQFKDVKKDHLLHLKEGKREQAFKEYQEAEATFDVKIEAISNYSLNILKKLDLSEAAEKRKSNFNRLVDGLDEFNLLNFNKCDTHIPFCYPFWAKKSISRESLISQQIYFPQLWTNVLTQKDSSNFIFEQNVARKMFPLPIDHRWGKAEMNYIITKVKEQF